jgi:hypothetical protein
MSEVPFPLIQEFLNETVDVTECSQTFTVDGKKITFEFARVADDDPTIAALSLAAEAEGFDLRIWTPGTMGTMEHRPDRLNAFVRKSPDGTHYRIAKLTIG